MKSNGLVAIPTAVYYNAGSYESEDFYVKNHVRVNGQLLQMNKRWGDLKLKQKEWIMRMAKYEYDRFVAERHKLPVHGSKQQLIEHIYSIIGAMRFQCAIFALSMRRTSP